MRLPDSVPPKPPATEARQVSRIAARSVVESTRASGWIGTFHHIVVGSAACVEKPLRRAVVPFCVGIDRHDAKCNPRSAPGPGLERFVDQPPVELAFHWFDFVPVQAEAGDGIRKTALAVRQTLRHHPALARIDKHLVGLVEPFDDLFGFGLRGFICKSQSRHSGNRSGGGYTAKKSATFHGFSCAGYLVSWLAHHAIVPHRIILATGCRVPPAAWPPPRSHPARERRPRCARTSGPESMSCRATHPPGRRPSPPPTPENHLCLASVTPTSRPQAPPVSWA